MMATEQLGGLQAEAQDKMAKPEVDMGRASQHDATFDVFDRNFGVEHGAEDREVRCALPFPLGRRNLARTPCIRRRR